MKQAPEPCEHGIPVRNGRHDCPDCCAAAFQRLARAGLTPSPYESNPTPPPDPRAEALAAKIRHEARTRNDGNGWIRYVDRHARLPFPPSAPVTTTVDEQVALAQRGGLVWAADGLGRRFRPDVNAAEVITWLDGAADVRRRDKVIPQRSSPVKSSKHDDLDYE